MAHGLPIAGTGSAAAAPRVDALLRGRDARFAGAYVHVPFCFHKCHYCDFYSFVDAQDRQEAYVQRLEEELAAMAGFVGAPLETLFVGGGTPTLLRPPLLARALAAVRAHLPFAADAEWTVEANPETVTPEVAQTLVAAGVNRVSLGAQSFDPALLQTLERWHEPASVARAVGHLRAAGVARVSLDLIFGIPGATLEQWERDLDQALALEPQHLSCYGLTYEPNTAMTRRLQRGEFEPCEEDLEAAMFERTQARLGAAGFEQYEISNWARGAPERCRHNLLYWRNRDWLAFGPSASGHASGLRWKNVPRLADWLEQGPGSPAVDVEQATPDMRAGERLMMGLRLREGIAPAELEEILALGARGGERRRAIEAACAQGLLERDAAGLRFTPRGVLLANEVLATLV
ncbi:MAG: radical SAM family heme chaperone HemW [Phycisphaerales bacterium]